MNIMRIENYYGIKSYNIQNTVPQFYGFKFNRGLFADIFTRSGDGLHGISGIKPGVFGGTVCRGSIPLPEFWNCVSKKERQKLLQSGMSTNRDGFAGSFLKADSAVPISTSFVHDCSVMYLYNEKKHTHSLYHASSDTSKGTLASVISLLMDEGFSKGIIIPGCSEFWEDHKNNMVNMFELMKKREPKAVIQVYHDSTPFPEIVGYQGKVFEIPNRDIKKQKEIGIKYPEDCGQASFKIVDVQHFNSFDKIVYGCNQSSEGDGLKKEFKEAGFPKEILKILNKLIDKKVDFLKFIENSDSLLALELFEKTVGYDMNMFDTALVSQYEKLLLEELEYVKTKEGLDLFCEKASCYSGFDYMKSLKIAIKRKEEVFNV